MADKQFFSIEVVDLDREGRDHGDTVDVYAADFFEACAVAVDQYKLDNPWHHANVMAVIDAPFLIED